MEVVVVVTDSEITSGSATKVIVVGVDGSTEVVIGASGVVEATA